MVDFFERHLEMWMRNIKDTEKEPNIGKSAKALLMVSHILAYNTSSIFIPTLWICNYSKSLSFNLLSVPSMECELSPLPPFWLPPFLEYLDSSLLFISGLILLMLDAFYAHSIIRFGYK